MVKGNKKIKVAHFIGSIQEGGAETLVKDYALLLDKEKFDITIIVLRRIPNSANDKVLRDNHTHIVSIYKNNSAFFKILQRLNRWWYLPLRLKKILKAEEIEILHIHMDLLEYVGRIANSIPGIKLFYTCHSEPQYHFGDRRPRERAAAKKLLRTNGLQLIALHDAMRQELNKMFGIENTVVIRNGIDFKRFQIQETQKEARERIGIPEDAFVLGHVGRFSEAKNHQFLIRAFQAVSQKKENAFLLLVGDGKLKSDIEKELVALGLTGRYRILSRRSDIPQLMRAMDVFVFPSKFEGLGIVLIEAQVSSLRCIVSDAVPQEAFQTELAVPVSLEKTPAEWCDIILDDSIKGTSHGDINDYDMNKEIKRLEALYLKAADRAAPGD